jgi:DNA replication ATP-dependent helicase Dna2
LFDTVIIDEASQMLEPQTLSLINLAKRAILIGDHKQLPAVVQSEDAQRSGLAVSMFERLVNTFPNAKKMLTLQYRMNELIEEFPSWKFYDGKMKAATLEIGSQRLSDLDNVQLEKIQDPWANSLLLPDEPIIYVKTYGVCHEKVNNLEASIAVKIVKGLMQAGLKEKDVAVIAPYRAQVAEIRRRLYSFLPNVDVDTVDRFQGSEREVVIISLTQSKAFNQPIFKDERRWNVAITRAKKMFIIIGHPNSKANRMMSELLNHIQEKGKVVIGELSDTTVD